MSQNGSNDNFEKQDQLRPNSLFCQENLMFNFFSFIFIERCLKINNLFNHL